MQPSVKITQLGACVAILLTSFAGNALAEESDGFSRAFQDVSANAEGNRAVVIAGQHKSTVRQPALPYDEPQVGPPSRYKPSFLPFHTPSPMPAGLNADQVASVGTRVAAGVEVPGARFVMQPDPGRNEWNGLPVGFPVWLHVEHPAPIRVQVSDSGVVVDLRAYPVAAVFDTGDGQRYRCVATTVRRLDEDPKVKSPTCHHTYLEKGEYVISAWVEWRVDWSALGQSGSLRLVSEPDRYGLTVIELRSVVVR